MAGTKMSTDQDLEIQRLKLEVEALKAFTEQMRKGWIKRDFLIEQLDEAMASAEQIAEDTALVGGFVSGLDLVETDEQIINRAIKIIKSVQKK